MRRSEWRRRADDPKIPFGWWWRGVFRSRWILCVPLLPISLALVWDRPWLVMLPMGAVMLGVRLHRRWTPDPLGGMLPDPAPAGLFRSSVAYRRMGVVMGTDDMALVLVDDWLVAEGVRSSFALRPEDVWKLTTGSDHRGRLVLSDGGEVRLAGLDDRARIVLERWHRPERWMEGEPTFPPARAHPQEVARWGACSILGGTMWPVFNLVAILLHAGSEVKIGSMLFGFVFGGAMAAYGMNRLVRVLRIDAAASKALVGQAQPRQGRVECGDSSPLGSGDSSPRVSLGIDEGAKLRR